MAAVLGDMYELGDTSAELHEQVGLEFARMGGEMLYTFGESANNIAIGAVLGGVLNENIYRNESVSAPEITGEMLLDTLSVGDVLLVKASRGARAERILNYIKENKERIRKA